jgi:glycosyltransferase involved in cell wall biosynthesis
VKIALIAPPWFPVPPSRYGGIEWIVWLLAEGLTAAGNEVTLFATGESSTSATLEYVYEESPSSDIGRSYPDLRHVLHCYARQGEFDLVHDHSGLVAAAIAGGLTTPAAHTVHGPLAGIPGAMYEQIASVAPRLGLISISMNQRQFKPGLNWIGNCPNALDLELYPFDPAEGDYLLFLGRMNPEKGAHRAIRTALETGLPLKLAGKQREPLEEEYFEVHVRPYLGGNIEYVGEVSHWEKVELLQHARVTLFPIEWDEPFGLVMIESMACGTPVIASRWGAVPEVVQPGRSGVIVDDWRDAAAAIEEAERLSRVGCRTYVEERFASARLVENHLAAYGTLLAGAEPVVVSPETLS